MKKSLIALMLTAMSALVLTGCFQAQQAEKQPEATSQAQEEVTLPPAEKISDETVSDGGGGVAADESAANYPSTFQHDGYGFRVVIPA